MCVYVLRVRFCVRHICIYIIYIYIRIYIYSFSFIHTLYFFSFLSKIILFSLLLLSFCIFFFFFFFFVWIHLQSNSSWQWLDRIAFDENTFVFANQFLFVYRACYEVSCFVPIFVAVSGLPNFLVSPLFSAFISRFASEQRNWTVIERGKTIFVCTSVHAYRIAEIVGKRKRNLTADSL